MQGARMPASGTKPATTRPHSPSSRPFVTHNSLGGGCCLSPLCTQEARGGHTPAAGRLGGGGSLSPLTALARREGSCAGAAASLGRKRRLGGWWLWLGGGTLELP